MTIGPRLALEGIRVVDLTMVFAGPYATKLLADMGAQVIKVESCTRLDMARGRPHAKTGPYPDGIPGEQPYNRAAYFNELNRNKLGLTLDLGKQAGKEVFKKLVAVSDVVIENFSVRVMKNFGLDYPVLREIKPDLIMASISGYGTSGPYRDYVTFGTGIEAMSLSSDLTGYPNGLPLKPGIAYGDPTGGLFAAFAVLATLRNRQQTGQGQYIDLALRDVVAQMFADAIMDYSMNGRVQRRQGNRHSSMAPHGCYRCQGDDKWVAIAVGTDGEWQALCGVMGRPALALDNRFADVATRWRNQAELDPLITEWTVGQDQIEVMQALQAAGVPASAVLNIQSIMSDPHYAARGYFPMVTHAAAGTHPYPGVSWKLNKTPGGIRQPAPLFAEHNVLVLGEILGLSTAEMTSLHQDGVIGDRPNLD